MPRTRMSVAKGRPERLTCNGVPGQPRPANGNVSAAARSLKVARATLYRKLKHFGMLS